MDSLETMFTYFWSLFLFSLIGTILAFLFGIFFDVLDEVSLVAGIDMPTYISVIGWIISIISLFLFVVSHLAVMKKIFDGTRLSVGKCISFGFKKIFPYIAVLWKSLVYSATPSLLIIFVILVLARLVYPHFVTIIVLSFVSFILLFVAFIRSINVFFAPYVFVKENVRPKTSVERSIDMTNGKWWAIFLRGIIAMFITNIVLWMMFFAVKTFLHYDFFITSLWYENIIYYVVLFVLTNMAYMFSITLGAQLYIYFKK